MESFELTDDPKTSGEGGATRFRKIHAQVEIGVKEVRGENGVTDFIRLVVPVPQGDPKEGVLPPLESWADSVD